MTYFKVLLVALLFSIGPTGAALADFTDAQARKMVTAATAKAKAGLYLKGDAIRSALLGRVFQIRVPGSPTIQNMQFYSTNYVISIGFQSTVYDWKVSRSLFCFKRKDAKTFACRHRLVKLASGMVLVGRNAADGVAMKPKIKALQ